MVAIPAQTILYESARPWFVRASLPPEIAEALRPIAGVVVRDGLWDIPREVAEMHNVVPPLPLGEAPPSWTRGLYPWQAEHVASLLATNRRGIDNDAMGLGKSAVAIRAIWNTETTIIVGPSVTAESWRREVRRVTANRGGFGLPGDEVRVVESGADAATLDYSKHLWVFTSYGLADKLPQPWPVRFNLIIDEIHFIKNGRTEGANRELSIARTRAVRAMADAAEAVIGLSGTPISDQTPDLWHQLDTVWPGRFGRTIWEFAFRYCLVSQDRFGKAIKGLNPEYAPELRERLRRCVRRVTREEVAHLLPAVRVETVKIKTKRNKDLRAYEARFAENFRAHAEGLGHYLERTSDAKLSAVADAVAQAQAQGRPHVAVLCYLKSTAAKLAAALGAELVDGEMTREQRIAVLDAQAAKPASVTVCTMHSIGIGINQLNFVTYAAFAELYWNPAVVDQALRRFGRLGGTGDVLVQFFLASGTLDEKIAHVLGRKLKDLKTVLASGKADEQLLTAVTPEMSVDEFAEALREVTASAIERDEFFT